jgi:hypothetical protein
MISGTTEENPMRKFWDRVRKPVAYLAGLLLHHTADKLVFSMLSGSVVGFFGFLVSGLMVFGLLRAASIIG